MKRELIASVVLTGGLLTACAEPSPTVVGSLWQVTNIWSTPGAPSALPPGAAGHANLVFGEISVTGSTGCSAIQGAVTFTSDEQPSSVVDADAVTFDLVEIDPPADDCANAWTHHQLAELITPGASFDLHQESDVELTLTVQGEEIDRPAIGLSSI